MSLEPIRVRYQLGCGPDSIVGGFEVPVQAAMHGHLNNNIDWKNLSDISLAGMMKMRDYIRLVHRTEREQAERRAEEERIEKAAKELNKDNVSEDEACGACTVDTGIVIEGTPELKEKRGEQGEASAIPPAAPSTQATSATPATPNERSEGEKVLIQIAWRGTKDRPRFQMTLGRGTPLRLALHRFAWRIGTPVESLCMHLGQMTVRGYETPADVSADPKRNTLVEELTE